MYLPRGTPVHYLGSQIVILSLFDMHHADDRASELARRPPRSTRRRRAGAHWVLSSVVLEQIQAGGVAAGPGGRGAGAVGA
jgi:hypothetical protein